MLFFPVSTRSGSVDEHGRRTRRLGDEPRGRMSAERIRRNEDRPGEVERGDLSGHERKIEGGVGDASMTIMRQVWAGISYRPGRTSRPPNKREDGRSAEHRGSSALQQLRGQSRGIILVMRERSFNKLSCSQPNSPNVYGVGLLSMIAWNLTDKMPVIALIGTIRGGRNRHACRSSSRRCLGLGHESGHPGLSQQPAVPSVVARPPYRSSCHRSWSREVGDKCQARSPSSLNRRAGGRYNRDS